MRTRQVLVLALISALGAAVVLAPVAGRAQSRSETLADIRQQLSVLYNFFE